MGIGSLENIETWNSLLERSRALFEKNLLELFSFVQQFFFSSCREEWGSQFRDCRNCVVKIFKRVEQVVS